METKKIYKVGDTFKPKRSRVEYTVLATFEDDGHQFFVAKKQTNWGWTYSNVFTYDEEGNIYERS